MDSFVIEKLKEWQLYTLVDTFKDFRRLYPEADRKLFEDWAAVADKILAYAQQDGKVLLELGDMTPDAKGESAFKVLPTLLPPSVYKKGEKVFRPTTTESRKSLTYNLWGPTLWNICKMQRTVMHSSSFCALGMRQRHPRPSALFRGMPLKQTRCLKLLIFVSSPSLCWM